MQRERVLVLALLVQLVDLHDAPREHVREGRDAACGPDAQTADQEIRLAAKGREALWWQLAGDCSALRQLSLLGDFILAGRKDSENE